MRFAHEKSGMLKASEMQKKNKREVKTTAKNNKKEPLI